MCPIYRFFFLLSKSSYRLPITMINAQIIFFRHTSIRGMTNIYVKRCGFWQSKSALFLKNVFLQFFSDIFLLVDEKNLPGNKLCMKKIAFSRIYFQTLYQMFLWRKNSWWFGDITWIAAKMISCRVSWIFFSNFPLKYKHSNIYMNLCILFYK